MSTSSPHTGPTSPMMRPPLYSFPSSSSARTHSSPISRTPLISRRSDERTVGPRVRASDQITYRQSIHSGREGSLYGGRKEVLAGPLEDDLRLFARHCKQFYFSLDPSDDSSRFISSTLASLPPTHRPAYTRVQSSLRAHAHLHHLRLRVSTFHALLSALTTSGSLAPSFRLDLGSDGAKDERLRRVEAFATKWCSAGTEPFFRGLWAALRLQSRGEGGAGGHRVVWEIDDAVFQESAGPEFMHEAVLILKGILGFSDQPLTTPPRLRRVRTIPRRSEDQNRTRATSDPFEDKKARKPSPRRSASEDRPLLADDTEVEELDEELDDDEIANEEIELHKPRSRLWVFPSHIDNQEAERLMGVLPSSLARDRKGKAKDVRFPYIRPGRGLKALELGAWEDITVGDVTAKVPRLDQEEQEGVVRDGTGRMWTGIEARNAGWEGGQWFRFVRWLRRIFGMA